MFLADALLGDGLQTNFLSLSEFCNQNTRALALVLQLIGLLQLAVDRQHILIVHGLKTKRDVIEIGKQINYIIADRYLPRKKNKL